MPATAVKVRTSVSTSRLGEWLIDPLHVSSGIAPRPELQGLRVFERHECVRHEMGYPDQRPGSQRQALGLALEFREEFQLAPEHVDVVSRIPVVMIPPNGPFLRVHQHYSPECSLVEDACYCSALIAERGLGPAYEEPAVANHN